MEEKIAWLEIAVNDAMSMSVVEGRGGLLNETSGLLQRKCAVAG
jgi:hypothetical protein